MLISDIRTLCSGCQGSGHQAGFQALGVSQINYRGVCPSCGGKGFVLSELGENLLKTLEPYIVEWIEKKMAQAQAKVKSSPPSQET